ncbi:MAG: glycine--tRNA ligase [bacterium]
MDEIIALSKRRGFIYPSSEIYGGIAGFWDYGPLGVELKNNIKKQWWKDNVRIRDDIVGIDASIIMNPQVWKESGHIEAFTDPLVECKICNKRFRFDHYKEILCNDKKPHKETSLTEPKVFNLLTEVYLGVTEPKQKAYLRGEITQGTFVNFTNVVDSTRVKIPFGIAQIGKAFRNEITPGNFTYRSREFEQMEIEFFINPQDKNKTPEDWFEYWKNQRMQWYKNLGLKSDNLRFRPHKENERAHYAKDATDIEYNAPFGWSEFEGIHNRGNWDLSRHKLKYQDPESSEEYVPWVIETSGGVDRSTLFFLLDSYVKEEKREYLKLHPLLSPFKAAVFPLLANKLELIEKAKTIFNDLKIKYSIAWDDRGNIGKRYAYQDEIGTPICITVDFQTLKDNTVTLRDRDTIKQERLKIEEIENSIDKILV